VHPPNLRLHVTWNEPDRFRGKDGANAAFWVFLCRPEHRPARGTWNGIGAVLHSPRTCAPARAPILKPRLPGGAFSQAMREPEAGRRIGKPCRPRAGSPTHAPAGPDTKA